MAKNSNTDTVWCIAYINRDHIKIVEEELDKYNYNVTAYIPTVKILKKKFKGQNIFENVPLLFNYGFFKIDYEDAVRPSFLLELRNRITCIYGWVKDPTRAINGSPRLSMTNSDTFSGVPVTALATDKEISRLIKKSKKLGIYSAEDISKLSPGDYIKLKGYPFDNMPAEIISINVKKGSVKVSLLMDSMIKEATVSFENVFYTVYQGLNENSREKSYDESSEKYGPNSIDKMLYQNLDIDG
jgi:transcription antitermination factor NusG